MNLRKRFTKSYIWSTLMYGCEAWTINKKVVNKIETADMWFYRRMLKISWTDRVRNGKISHRSGTKREMMIAIRWRQLRSLGHTMRLQQLENVWVSGRVVTETIRQPDKIRRRRNQPGAVVEVDRKKIRLAFHSGQLPGGYGTSVR